MTLFLTLALVGTALLVFAAVIHGVAELLRTFEESDRLKDDPHAPPPTRTPPST